MTKTPPKPLTRIDLDIVVAGSKCNDPGCKCGGQDAAKAVSIICREHQSAGVRVEYSKGILTLICSKCGFGVHRIAVA